MTAFLYKGFIFLGILVLSLLVLLASADKSLIPAPMITNSYSFNEKLFSSDAFNSEYLAVGSSMTLNNLSSKEIIEKTGSESFFNYASWGMSIVDVHEFVKLYLEVYNPKVVFIASNAMDFYKPSIQYNKKEILSKLRNLDASPFFYYLKHIDARYYYYRYLDNKVNKVRNDVYASVKFSPHGEVLLSAKNFSIDKGRWQKQLEFEKIDSINYIYLDSLCHLLSSKNIEFIFIQTPMRQNIMSKEHTAKLEEHKELVKNILKDYSFQFIDGMEKEWEDSLFVDFAHFNEKGAGIFTNYCMEKMKNDYSMLLHPF